MSHPCSNPDCTKNCYSRFTYCTACRKMQAKKQCDHPNCTKQCYAQFCKKHCKATQQCEYIKKTGERCTCTTMHQLCFKHSEKTRAYLTAYKRAHRSPQKPISQAISCTAN